MIIITQSRLLYLVVASFIGFFVVHLIVATPGRLLDLLNKELIKTDDCKVLVLDEVGQIKILIYLEPLLLKSCFDMFMLDA